MTGTTELDTTGPEPTDLEQGFEQYRREGDRGGFAYREPARAVPPRHPRRWEYAPH
jgi:hypothetical protein